MEQEKSKGLGLIFAKAAGAGAFCFAAMGGILTALNHTPSDAMTLGAYFGGVVAVAYGATRVMMRKDTGASCCEHHKPKEP